MSNLKNRADRLEKAVNPWDNTVAVRFRFGGKEPEAPFIMPLSLWRAFEKEARESGRGAPGWAAKRPAGGLNRVPGHRDNLGTNLKIHTFKGRSGQ